MKERVGSKGMKKKQQSNQAHDTFQMRLKIPNDMGYKKLCERGKELCNTQFRCLVKMYFVIFYQFELILVLEMKIKTIYLGLYDLTI